MWKHVGALLRWGPAVAGFGSGSGRLAKLLAVAGLGLVVFTGRAEAQRATMQVTVQIVHGNDFRATPAVERPQAAQVKAGADTGERRLTVGSVAPWQLLVTTEQPLAPETRRVLRASAGEGERVTAGAPGAAVTVTIPGESESSVVMYVLVTN